MRPIIKGRLKTNVNFARETLQEYWKHVQRNLLMFCAILILVPAAALLLSTLVPYYLSQVVGALASGNTNVTREVLLAITLGTAGLACNYVGFQLMTRHEARMYSSLINDAASKLLYKDYTFFANEKIGALTTKFLDFVRSYVALQNLFIIRTLGFAISMGVGLALVARSSLPLALLLFALIIIILIQIRITLKIRAPYRDKRKTLRAQIVGEVADALTNNIIVKTFAKEQRELELTRQKTTEHEEIFLKDIGIVTTEGTLRNLITTFVQIAAIILAAFLIQRGRIDIATVVFSLTYLQRIAAQVFTLGEMVNGYDAAFLEAAPMTEMLLKQDHVLDLANADKLQHVSGTIIFRNVFYSYKDGGDAIQGITISIQAGEKLGIVGHSGAGKSTITKLLLRFDDVTEGSIEIDGHDIRTITQQSLREAIAYVPQEPMLFHRTLAENIGYAHDKATSKDVETAAKKAHAHEFIKDLPKGYETLVGERGVKLSGGQRQRVAIARAILKDAPILVLDEATSALDSESEKLIQDALNKLMEGRTTIVIAHRLSTIQKMDRIIVLDKGTIVEEGSHQELLKHGGTYARLWARQSGGFLED